MRRLFSLAASVLVTFLSVVAQAQSGPPSQSATRTNQTIIFVCLHGSVNSQIASAYFNRIAQDRRLPFTAVSRGIEVYPTIPVRILDNLVLDGLAPANIPHERTSDKANGASRVLAFDRVPPEQRGDAQVTFGLMSPLELTIMTPHATRS
jgi:hypothetical protein